MPLPVTLRIINGGCTGGIRWAGSLTLVTSFIRYMKAAERLSSRAMAASNSHACSLMIHCAEGRCSSMLLLSKRPGCAGAVRKQSATHTPGNRILQYSSDFSTSVDSHSARTLFHSSSVLMAVALPSGHKILKPLMVTPKDEIRVKSVSVIEIHLVNLSSNARCASVSPARIRCNPAFLLSIHELRCSLSAVAVIVYAAPNGRRQCTTRAHSKLLIQLSALTIL